MYDDPYGSRKATPTSLEGLEARFNALPLWACYGLIGLNALIVVALCAVFVSMLSEAFSPPQQSDVVAQVSTPTVVSTPTTVPMPSSASRSSHYPPTMLPDLFALAAKGDASVVHEFHSEGVGLATCPQPRREVTVDPNITGQQLAEDLLAYYYDQKLDNTCGALVIAYHNQSEAGDAYTAGRINVDVTDLNGMANTDPNASNLTHKLTLDIGGLGANQEYIVMY